MFQPRTEMSAKPADSTVTLLAACRGGDRRALDVLFERYYPIVVRIAELRLRRRIRGHEEVEDIVQDSLLDVFKGLDHFEMRSEGDFRDWLATIVANNIRDRFRRANSQKRGAGREQRRADLPTQALSESLFAGRAPSPSQHARAAELELRIERAIMNDLEDPFREVIILRKLCGMSYEEIAKSLGYGSTSSARALYTRAMDKLRACL
jgi:RNA polymerase sigma-70 factor (ECF subfamily)